jgi:ACS family hexuronate transporter-like MFS transporter
MTNPLDYAAPALQPVGRARWMVCFLLFLATTINYMDRQAISLLKGTISKDLGWTEYDYTHVIMAFQAAYAIGYLVSGRWIDIVGVKFGLAAAVAVWSAAATAHGLANGVIAFAVARAALGLSEGANFPAAIKSVGEWFPKKERAFAFGLLNSGANIGAIVTPVIIAVLTARYGWHAAFIAVGLTGFVWLGIWLLFYHRPEDHPRVSPGELAYIRSDPPDPPFRVTWASLLRHRATWAIVVGMTLTNPVWYFYLFWIPDYLAKSKHLNLQSSTLPVMVIYIMADLGSISGGWLSSALIGLGWSTNAARKTALLVCALCVVPILAVAGLQSLWPAVLLIGLAAAAHQGWAANLYTLASDVMPKPAIASLVGLSCMPGAIVSIFFASLIARVVTRTGSYAIPFAIASGSYLTALVLVQIILPRIQMISFAPPAETDANAKARRKTRRGS